ncbi:MAG: PepSY domain-containing protein, partial [Verrucomicrobiae bacterium]|nr:PepSY domain-containing protein [Verrucomicrobiae bacterium]
DGHEDEQGFAHDAQDALLSLHTGWFAGPVLRWLYFGSGLLGSGLVATGLILWTVKRRPKTARGVSPSFGHQLVERLNVGTIAGLPAGFAVYFWANRLVPVGWPDRDRWEIHMLFLTWAVLLLYPAFRPILHAWREELALTGILFGLVPVLNFLTTQRHLGMTLPAGDWELAGFDLTILGLGALFAWASWRVGRQLAAPEPAVPALHNKGRAA